VVGIKDSQNDLDWFRQVMSAVSDRGRPFRGFLGTRILIDAGLIAGAHGAIPGISNVGAADCVGAWEAAKRGEWHRADQHTRNLLKIQQIINLAKGSANSQSFSGMKAILKALGVISSARVRLPLRTVTPEEEARIAAAVREAGLRAPATLAH
jgi:4-hydroxy-tetrahydrodipicolinate synthase